MTNALDIRERQRSRIKAIQRAQAAAGAELWGTPLGALIEAGPANPERRAACERDLMLFLQTYFPMSTGLSPFSEDHDRVVSRIEDCTFTGGLFVEAVYRGFAKTTINQNTTLWALGYAHRRCIPLFGATDPLADENMNSVKLELETNDLLLEDFPEICAPIRALQGRPQRCASQTWKGEPTRIEWTADQIVLPTIEGSKASGGIFVSRGLTAASRGLVFKRADGTNQRPDMFLVDDPQTDESAQSPTQVQKRLDIIRRSILRSGGHFRKLAGVVACTVRASNDVAEQLLDPKLSPAWQAERIKMVRRWADEHGDEATALVPKKLGPLWRKYAEIRNTFDRDNPNDQKRAWRDATAFYSEQRAGMDAGCVVSWAGCFDREHEISAIQHAYNILIDEGADIVATECQNGTPLEILPDGMLTAGQIAQKVNGYARGTIPPDATLLTAFIDVQDAVLFWIVVAWRQDFTGYVVDYGCWPEQRRTYFTLREITPTLADEYGGGKEAAWHAGLKALTAKLLGNSWPVHGGGGMKAAKCLVDANYGESTDTVYAFVRQSEFGGVLLPTHGKGVKATGSPMHLWPKQEGEKSGLSWRERLSPKHRTRYGLYDTNYWKSFAHARLFVKLADAGGLSLFDADPRTHQMLADHLTAEKPLLVEVHGGRRVMEWQEPPPDRDNHWLDGLVGCAVAGSMLGAVLETMRPKPGKPKRSLQDMAAQARGR